MNEKVAIVQVKIPHYREELFIAVCKRVPGIKIFHSSYLSNDGLVESLSFPFSNEHVNVTEVRGFTLQKLTKQILFDDYNYVVLGLELKILSNLLIAVLCRIRKIKLIFWTHGYNVHLKEKNIRFFVDRFVKTILMRMAFKILLYTEYGYKELIRWRIPARKIIILNNTINEKLYEFYITKFRTSEKIIGSDKEKLKLAMVGRLTKAKKIEILIDLVVLLRTSYPQVSALIIGDGPERERLEALAKVKGVEDRVVFYGTINEPESLVPLLMKADMMVQPGAVGLSIVTSFICGLPFITFQDAGHGPEIAYLKSDCNGYIGRSLEDIKEWIIHNYSNKERMEKLRQGCFKVIEDEVKFEYFIDRFVSAFQ